MSTSDRPQSAPDVDTTTTVPCTYLPPEIWTMIISSAIDSWRQDDNPQDLLSTVLALSSVSPSFHAHVLHVTQRVLADLHYDCTVVWNDRVRALFRSTFLGHERYDTCKHGEEADVECGTLLAQAVASSHPWKHIYCGQCLLETRILQPRLSRIGDFYRHRISTDAAYFGLHKLRCLLVLGAGVRDIRVSIGVGDTKVVEEGHLVVIGGRFGF